MSDADYTNFALNLAQKLIGIGLDAYLTSKQTAQETKDRLVAALAEGSAAMSSLDAELAADDKASDDALHAKFKP